MFRYIKLVFVAWFLFWVIEGFVYAQGQPQVPTSPSTPSTTEETVDKTVPVTPPAVAPSTPVPEAPPPDSAPPPAPSPTPDLPPPYTPSPFVQNYILDRLYLGFHLGQSFVMFDKTVQSSQGYVSIIFDYLVGDLLKQTNPLLLRSYGTLEFTSVSLQTLQSKTFYRAAQNQYIVGFGTSVPFSSVSTGAVWKENMVFNFSGGLGLLSYNTLNYQLNGNNRYSSNQLDMGFLIKLKGSVDYKVWGPWMVTLNGATTMGSSFVTIIGLGVRSGF